MENAFLLGWIRDAGRLALNGRGGTLKVEQTSFDRFLLTLHGNREEAGKLVVHIRRRVATFAECNRVPDAEGFADKVMDVLEREAQREEIRCLGSLAYAVARRVLMEAWREASRAPSPFDDGLSGCQRAVPPASEEPQDRSLSEKRSECLHRCLQTLNREDRELIIRYHQLKGGAEKLYRARKELAQNYGTGSRNLALRIHRIRKHKLDPCVVDCTKSSSAAMK
jgi:DNA-directed RNA polymerase specialized sigma24 family protein